ncbi:MAG TPA: outer membrane lipoprotein chaperone LolA [Terriglobales bacterium]|nr:outer membrane lipoprotein chaperone LolA [Terriglobales bacterium]
MTKVRTTTLVFLLCICSSLVLSQGKQDKNDELKALANKVDEHYNGLKSLRSQFHESYSGMGMSRRESGMLYLKKPGRMRWEYQTPREKLFVSDGKTAWFYVPGEQQARRAPVSKIDDIRSPLRFLLGKTKLLKEFRELSFSSSLKPLNPGNFVLRGVPKGMEDRISMVTLEVSPGGRIDRITMEEVDGATTDFIFSQEQENVPVADNLFKFQPPRGVEIVEAKELGN